MKLTELQVLSKSDIEQIHESSLEILEKMGLIIESKKVLDMLKENGCEVDYAAQVAKFPVKVVGRCLKTVPPTVKLCDRDGNPTVALGGGAKYCASGHNAIFTLTDEKGNRHDATMRDVEEFAILSDQLSDIDVIGVPYNTQDVTPQTAILYAIKTILENSKKPIFFSCEHEALNRAAAEMARTILGRKDLSEGCNLISQLSTTSPLYWERGAVESLYLLSKEGMPIDFLPQPISGVTAPLTLAGLLTMHNTEVLSGIVITQLANPGLPVVYGAAWTTYDMKMINVLLGRPEASLLRIAGAQMARFYNMPSHTTAPDTDVNTHDEQNAWEKMLSTIAGLIGGNDLIMNLGLFGTGMSITPAQLVIDNEICKIVKRFSRGFEVNKDTIALDTIFNAGHRGTYLIEDHTFEYLRSGEHEELSVANSANYEVWKAKGMQDIVDRAKVKAKQILDKGNRCPLDPAISKKLEEIITVCEKSMGLI